MTLFLVIINAVVAIFITGIVLFVFQYRKRKIMHQKEKEEIEKQHKIDLLNTELQIQKQTMQFIGQEIHDSVAQKLTLASIYTQHLDFDYALSGANDRLAGVNKIITDSVLELRQLSKRLTDNQLQTADLQALVQIECEQVNATGICTASMEVDGLPNIDIVTKSSILRIVQEFIQNSIKHAACRHVFIRMQYNNDGLFILLQDDGKGFDIEKEIGKGIGLSNMQRRTQALNGQYNFQSAEGQGTTLHINIPLIQTDA